MKAFVIQRPLLTVHEHGNGNFLKLPLCLDDNAGPTSVEITRLERSQEMDACRQRLLEFRSCNIWWINVLADKLNVGRELMLYPFPTNIRSEILLAIMGIPQGGHHDFRATIAPYGKPFKAPIGLPVLGFPDNHFHSIRYGITFRSSCDCWNGNCNNQNDYSDTSWPHKDLRPANDTANQRANGPKMKTKPHLLRVWLSRLLAQIFSRICLRMITEHTVAINKTSILFHAGI